MPYDLVIKGGRLITATDSYGVDLAVRGERITAIGRNLSGRREIDADLVLFDPAREMTFSPKTLHSPLDFCTYEGVTVTGFPTMTLSRGEIIVQNGQFVGQPGRGRFVERSYEGIEDKLDHGP